MRGLKIGVDLGSLRLPFRKGVVHATDAVRDLSGGREEPVQLGRGGADFPALLGTLEEFGYCGYVTVQAQSADDPAAEIADAIRYLRGL